MLAKVVEYELQMMSLSSVWNGLWVCYANIASLHIVSIFVYFLNEHLYLLFMHFLFGPFFSFAYYISRLTCLTLLHLDVSVTC